MTGRETIPLPPGRGARGAALSCSPGARANNLKDVTLRIPLHTLTCVTGVSGSGKSTLVHDTLYRALARALQGRVRAARRHDALRGLEYLKGVRLIDQEPIGRTPRSNPVTYVKAFDEIRKLLRRACPAPRRSGSARARSPSTCPAAAARRARATASRSSRCTSSRTSTSPARSARDAATGPRCCSVAYRGKDISQVLQLTVDEAVELLRRRIPSLARRLRVLQEVGLGYLRLGQPATTLSGGEAQRLKIAAELGAAPDPRQPLHPGRADHRAPPGRRPEAARRPRAARGRRQHRAGRRAPPRRHQDRRLGRGPGPRGRRGRRRASWPRAPRSRSPQVADVHREFPAEFLRDALAASASARPLTAGGGAPGSLRSRSVLSSRAMGMSSRDRYCIVGVGETEYSRRSEPQHARHGGRGDQEGDGRRRPHVPTRSTG